MEMGLVNLSFSFHAAEVDYHDLHSVGALLAAVVDALVERLVQLLLAPFPRVSDGALPLIRSHFRKTESMEIIHRGKPRHFSRWELSFDKNSSQHQSVARLIF